MSSLRIALVPLATLGLLLATPSCSSAGAEGAAKGAATGAVAGAVGGMLSAAIFGGDVARAAGRGAAWGAGSGAVAGGIAGEQRNAANEERKRDETEAQRQAELDKLRQEIGDDAYQGLAALTERKYEVAIAYARTAARSTNHDYALAGLWLEAMVHADNHRRADADDLLKKIVTADSKIDDAAQARKTLDELARGLQKIRDEYGIS